VTQSRARRGHCDLALIVIRERGALEGVFVRSFFEREGRGRLIRHLVLIAVGLAAIVALIVLGVQHS
jgi:hypothetical protein